MIIERFKIPSRIAAERDRCPLGGTKLSAGRFMRQDSGFTLIEVLVSLGIIGVVLTAIYTAYLNQVRTFNTQEQQVDMQQNVRVARYFLERELRLAGLDPTGNAGAAITVANAETITFSMDFTGGEGDGLDNDDDGVADEGSNGNDDDGDGQVDEPDEAEWYNGSTADANEQVTYSLSNDANANGINEGLPTENNDDSACNLLRNGQVIAVNIDALNFVYLGVNPADNSCEEDCLLVAPVANPEDIRSIQIALVARSGATVRTLSTDFTDTTTYSNQPPANQIILPAQNDNFRRIRLLTNVRCRNLGL